MEEIKISIMKNKIYNFKKNEKTLGEILKELKKISACCQTNCTESKINIRSDYDLYIKAKNLVISKGIASASLLQRNINIGYARAARLLELLEENGVIGPTRGIHPRQVLKKPSTKKANLYSAIDSDQISMLPPEGKNKQLKLVKKLK